MRESYKVARTERALGSPPSPSGRGGGGEGEGEGCKKSLETIGTPHPIPLPGGERELVR